MENYFIIGFMGAGKTTIGNLLKEQKAYRVCDLDDYISQKYKMTSNEIIETYSLEKFREYEKESFFEIIKEQKCILTLGGGSITIPEIYKYLHKNSNVLYLEANIETLYERIKNDKVNIRPLATQKSFDEVAELYYSRKDLYIRASSYRIDAGKNIDEVLKQVNQVIK